MESLESTESEASTYRPVSWLAVASLACGIASLVVFVGPPGSVAAPVIAVIVSVAALVRLRRDTSLAGETAARVGLALALFALFGGPSHWLLRQWQLRRMAATVAQSWVDSIREGDLRRAHQFTLSPEVRFGVDRPLAESYQRRSAARQVLAEFSAQPTIRQLRAMGGGESQVDAVEWEGATGGEAWFGVRLVVVDEADERHTLRVLVKRLPQRDGGYDWIVDKYHIGD